MKKLMGLMVIATFAIGSLTGCNVKDGLAGPPGQDGLNGQNGSDGTASCLVCHNDSNWAAKTTQYNFSKHSLGTTSARGEGNRFCMRCHTNEGFQIVTQTGLPWVAAESPDASKIQCETCHKMSSFNFSGDTVSQIMRTTNPVRLNYNNTFDLTAFVGWTTSPGVLTDFTQVKDSLTSHVNNLCITCHQIRGATSFTYTDTAAGKTTGPFKYTQMAYFPMGTAIVPGDTATVAKGNLKKATDSVAYLTGRSFAVHDGNQSNMFYGINGYDFNTPISTAARHHAKDNCNDCHMNEWDPITKEGGHSLIPNLKDASCVACHNLTDTLVTTKAIITAKLNQLGDLMVARKMAKKVTTAGVVSYTILATHDFLGKLYSKNPADSAVLYTNIASYNRTDSTTGAITYSNKITRTKDADLVNRIGRKWTYGELGAAYNYGFVGGFGGEISVHNDEYARKLLDLSIAWLQTH